MGAPKPPTLPHPLDPAGTWTDQRGSVAGLGNEFMFGESCAPGGSGSGGGPRVCIGVGSGQGDDGMSRNGDLFSSGPLQPRSWGHILQTSLETIDGVSCFDVASPQSLQCHAVGQNGLVLSCHHAVTPTCSAAGDWNTMHLPTPGGEPFYAVSCPSATLCVAVGGKPGSWLIAYTNSADTDTAPGAWTVASPLSNPAMVPGGVGYLLTISCPIAGACYAGGENGNLIYLDAPIGGNWSLAFVHTTTANIDQIGCGTENTNSRYCFAAVDGAIVGGDTTAGLTQPSGSDWPLSLNGTDALTMSCADSITCHAAGYHGDAWHETGTTASPSWGPEASGTGQELDVMDCFYLADQRCHALGQNTTLAWDSGGTNTPGMSSYSKTVLADGPLRYYRLNEPSGPSVFDSSATPADAKYQLPMAIGAVDNYGPGATGPILGDTDSALALLGRTDTWVNLPAQVDLAGDFTLEGWVNLAPTTVSNQVSMFGQAAPGNDTNFHQDCPGDLTKGRLRLYDGATDRITATTCEAGGSWAYYAITRSAGNLSLYRNGVLDATGPAAWNGTFSVARIGYGNVGTNLKGSIGQMAIYMVALKPAQVANHYFASGRVQQLAGQAPGAGSWQVTRGPSTTDPQAVYITEATTNQLDRLDLGTGVIAHHPAPGGVIGLTGVASDANFVYYASYAGDLLVKYDPVMLTSTPLPAPLFAGALTDVKIGGDGAVYFADPAAHRVGRYDPGTSAVTESNVSPGGCAPYGLTSSAGLMYFTSLTCAALGSVPEGGPLTAVTPTTYPYSDAGCQALFMTQGSDGLLHFTCANDAKIGTMRAAGTFDFVASPALVVHPHGISSGPDGAIYYNGQTSSGAGAIVRLKLSTNEQSLFPIPGSIDVTPYGLATGPDGKIYSVENTGNNLERLTPP